MDVDQILSEQTLVLTSLVQRSVPVRGLTVLKNITRRRYLRVTPEQWVILRLFQSPRTVPSVLGTAINERVCLPLSEFYELILKAASAGILEEPGSESDVVSASEWSWALRPRLAAGPQMVLFVLGLGAALWFRPALPATALDWAASIALLCACLSAGNLLAACLVRGAGGEVYRPRWRWLAAPPHFSAEIPDAAMVPLSDQVAISLSLPSLLAAAAGAAAWRRPEFAPFLLAGLVTSLRPVLGGRLVGLVHLGRRRAMSDAERSFLFPPNSGPEGRLRMLSRALVRPTVWARAAYAVAWAVATLFLGSRLAGIAPWERGFWLRYDAPVALWIAGAIALVVAGYLVWEGLLLVSSRAVSLSARLGRLWRRWLGPGELKVDEASLAGYLESSSVFGAFDAEERGRLARTMQVRRHGAWSALPGYGGEPKQVALILSGKVAARRQMPTGRTVRAQMLFEGDVLGMHDVADPKFPWYRFRARTPLVLLTIDRSLVAEPMLRRVPAESLSDLVLKAPFLRRVSLCRNWQRTIVDQFAGLAAITAYETGAPILSEDQTVDTFYVILQGDAKISRRSKKIGRVRVGEFFGEIGLMQNSAPIASVTANNNTRCLAFPRMELLRFVTGTYSVALELERVSSRRLGRPIFPLIKGDFRIM